ncbi:MAG: bifunctional glutamate N-acetyltransferase/amino-acid acetyltransferase ArgJ [Ignavibacteriales bacterium]|nr:bifunctional glutamate N-acetyltransferase/amino-acid acetyltransferase ArgJ [Ignavibacteriales bacterium]
MYQFIENGTVTSTPGFVAAGIFCGIKKRKKDLALIFSKKECTAAGTFTLNKVKAAPLILSQELINNKNLIRAILVNSGNANACTGESGYRDAEISQKYCAASLGISPSEVLVSSTGVIGQRMPMEKLLSGIDAIVPQLTITGGADAAEAILTTDKKEKSFAVKVKLEKDEITIGAICKGSGMIMPNMATMLAFITTDAKIDQPVLQKMLSNAVKNSFNKISVDGDTSTNDMVVLLSNGISGIEINEQSKDEKFFQEALHAICVAMAKSIVSDGEGATKLVTINVTGAHSQQDADMVGKAVANSSLVKTALYGQDANWGRIMSAAGNSGADIDPATMSIFFDDLPVVLPNYNIVLNEKAAKEILTKPEFRIKINLNGGNDSSTWWTCDFSEEYVRINADYRT